MQSRAGGKKASPDIVGQSASLVQPAAPLAWLGSGVEAGHAIPAAQL
jgi:hypothetical protein